MLHFMFYNKPIKSATLPDDQLLKALPKFNAAFSLTFFFFSSTFGVYLVSASVQNNYKKVGSQETFNWAHPNCERTNSWILPLLASYESHLHRALPSLFSPSSYKISVSLIYTLFKIEVYGKNNIITHVCLIWLLAVDFFLPYETEGTIEVKPQWIHTIKATGKVLWGVGGTSYFVVNS